MSTFDPEKLLRQDLNDFPPYSMGHVPLADMGKYIKLDLNENSFGPSPKAIKALAEMPYYNRYVGQEELREGIARYVGVDKAHIATSNGADEMIDMVQRVFLDRGDAMIDCPPAFEMYTFFARLNGARIVSVPRRDDFSVDVDAIEREVSSFKSQVVGSKPETCNLKLVFLANPSNPDGSVLSYADVERLLALPVMVVLDEAYAEFAGESYVSRVPTQSNLIILRTFSKWAGLAALRVGYCVAPKVITAKILQCKSPENLNAAGNVAAQASLEDKDYLLANVRRIVAERERLSAELVKLGWVQPLPSRANFILCRVVGRTGREVADALEKRGILIRAFGAPRLREYIRPAVGTPEQNDALVRALKELDAD
ncbi:MAG: histidinol-phosphate transaminase [Chloroflexi bacterium]|nr:histidinol-phosphate transaminase [Chloroflexota bacterium]